jgi:RND family efflux transporter MFP subunit
MSTMFRILSAVILTSLAATPALAEDFDCLIEPTQTIELRSPVVGVLERVHVRRGDKIRKGQLLVTLESDAEKAANDIAQFKAQMTAPIAVARTKVEYSRRTYERRREMHAEKLMSGQEKDEAEAELRSAEAELELAQENQALAKLEAQEQSSLLQRRTIASPFDGVVADQQAFPGEVVEPGDSRKSILKLAQLDPLRIHVILPRAIFGTIKIGDAAKIAPELPSLKPVQGKVRIVDSLVDAASGTFGVFVEVANPKLDLPAGIRCRATFAAGAAKP